MGLGAIIYFNYQVRVRYDELGELGELVDLFVYGRTNKFVLIIAEISGLICGLIPIIKTRFRLRRTLVGSLICLVDIFILFYQSA